MVGVRIGVGISFAERTRAPYELALRARPRHLLVVGEQILVERLEALRRARARRRFLIEPARQALLKAGAHLAHAVAHPAPVLAKGAAVNRVEMVFGIAQLLQSFSELFVGLGSQKARLTRVFFGLLGLGEQQPRLLLEQLAPAVYERLHRRIFGDHLTDAPVALALIFRAQAVVFLVKRAHNVISRHRRPP